MCGVWRFEECGEFGAVADPFCWGRKCRKTKLEGRPGGAEELGLSPGGPGGHGGLPGRSVWWCGKTPLGRYEGQAGARVQEGENKSWRGPGLGMGTGRREPIDHRGG